MISNLNILIAGGRDFDDYALLKSFIKDIIKEIDYDTITIISGMARGADMLGVRFAEENNYQLKKFPAQWNKYGKMAGFIRNKQMLNYLVNEKDECIVIAFWDGKSKGTGHTIETAKEMNIQCFVCNY
jgi:CRISPR/Cas system CSM-associated protein Csm4 (group 5 of RAMP superfamily)